MFHRVLNVGSAVNSLGNAMVPQPRPRPSPSSAPSLSSSQLMGIDVLGVPRTREEAGVFAWHSDNTLRGARRLGRTVGALIATGGAVWWSSRRK